MALITQAHMMVAFNRFLYFYELLSENSKILNELSQDKNFLYNKFVISLDFKFENPNHIYFDMFEHNIY